MKNIVTVTVLLTPIIDLNQRTGTVTAQWGKWFQAVQDFVNNLDFTDVSGVLDPAQLPPSVPVASFGSGPPTGTGLEGYIYFDTTDHPNYGGYVYHAGAWHAFSV